MIEYVVIAASGLAGLAGVPWPVAALTGAAVFLLTEAASLDAPATRLSNWQIGPWKSALGGAFIGAGECCLGWTVGAALSLLVGWA